MMTVEENNNYHNPDCEGCQRLQEELESAKAQWAADVAFIKENIINTDSLMRMYAEKCQDFEHATVNLERTKEVVDRLKSDCEIYERDFRDAFEQLKVLKQEKLDIEKENTEKNSLVSLLTRKLESAEASLKQFEIAVGKKKQDVDVEDLEKRLKKVTKDAERFSELNKNLNCKVQVQTRQLKRLGTRYQKSVKHLMKYADTLKSKGCLPSKDLRKLRLFSDVKEITSNLDISSEDENSDDNQDAVDNDGQALEDLLCESDSDDLQAVEQPASRNQTVASKEPVPQKVVTLDHATQTDFPIKESSQHRLHPCKCSVIAAKESTASQKPVCPTNGQSSANMPSFSELLTSSSESTNQGGTKGREALAGQKIDASVRPIARTYSKQASVKKTDEARLSLNSKSDSSMLNNNSTSSPLESALNALSSSQMTLEMPRTADDTQKDVVSKEVASSSSLHLPSSDHSLKAAKDKLAPSLPNISLEVDSVALPSVSTDMMLPEPPPISSELIETLSDDEIEVPTAETSDMVKKTSQVSKKPNVLDKKKKNDSVDFVMYDLRLSESSGSENHESTINMSNSGNSKVIGQTACQVSKDSDKLNEKKTSSVSSNVIEETGGQVSKDSDRLDEKKKHERSHEADGITHEEQCNKNVGEGNDSGNVSPSAYKLNASVGLFESPPSQIKEIKHPLNQDASQSAHDAVSLTSSTLPNDVRDVPKDSEKTADRIFKDNEANKAVTVKDESNITQEDLTSNMPAIASVVAEATEMTSTILDVSQEFVDEKPAIENILLPTQIPDRKETQKALEKEKKRLCRMIAKMKQPLVRPISPLLPDESLPENSVQIIQEVSKGNSKNNETTSEMFTDLFGSDESDFDKCDMSKAVPRPLFSSTPCSDKINRGGNRNKNRKKLLHQQSGGFELPPKDQLDDLSSLVCASDQIHKDENRTHGGSNPSHPEANMAQSTVPSHPEANLAQSIVPSHPGTSLTQSDATMDANNSQDADGNRPRSSLSADVHHDTETETFKVKLRLPSGSEYKAVSVHFEVDMKSREFNLTWAPEKKQAVAMNSAPVRSPVRPLPIMQPGPSSQPQEIAGTHASTHGNNVSTLPPQLRPTQHHSPFLAPRPVSFARSKSKPIVRAVTADTKKLPSIAWKNSDSSQLETLSSSSVSDVPNSSKINTSAPPPPPPTRRAVKFLGIDSLPQPRTFPPRKKLRASTSGDPERNSDSVQSSLPTTPRSDNSELANIASGTKNNLNPCNKKTISGNNSEENVAKEQPCQKQMRPKNGLEKKVGENVPNLPPKVDVADVVDNANKVAEAKRVFEAEKEQVDRMGNHGIKDHSELLLNTTDIEMKQSDISAANETSLEMTDTSLKVEERGSGRKGRKVTKRKLPHPNTVEESVISQTDVPPVKRICMSDIYPATGNSENDCNFWKLGKKNPLDENERIKQWLLQLFKKGWDPMGLQHVIKNAISTFANPNNISKPDELISTAIAHVTKTRRNIFIDFVDRQAKEPLVSDFESNFVTLLLELESKQKPHLKMLLHGFCTALLAHLLTKSISVHSMAAGCRLYTLVCRRLSQAERALIFCYDILLIKTSMSPFYLASVCGAWPEIFLKYGRKDDQLPMFRVFRYILSKKNALNFTFQKQCMAVLKELGDLTPSENDSAESIAKDLIQNLLLQKCHKAAGDGSTDQISKAFLLLAKWETWKWTVEVLLTRLFWPLVQKWAEQVAKSKNGSFETDETTIPDEAVITVLEFCGNIGIFCKEDEKSNTQEILVILQSLLTMESSSARPLQIIAFRSLLILLSQGFPVSTSHLHQWFSKHYEEVSSHLAHLLGPNIMEMLTSYFSNVSASASSRT